MSNRKYVEISKLVKSLETVGYNQNRPDSNYDDGFRAGLRKAARMLSDEPAADVAPVIHARWVRGEELKRLTGKDVDMDFLPIKESNYYCTNCHDTAIFGSVDGNSWDDFVDGYPDLDYFKTIYCPYCGAKMDAKEPSDKE